MKYCWHSILLTLYLTTLACAIYLTTIACATIACAIYLTTLACATPQLASSFSHMLNLHNLTEEVNSSQTERAVRLGEVRLCAHRLLSTSTEFACTRDVIFLCASVACHAMHEGGCTNLGCWQIGGVDELRAQGEPCKTYAKQLV